MKKFFKKFRKIKVKEAPSKHAGARRLFGQGMLLKRRAGNGERGTGNGERETGKRKVRTKPRIGKEVTDRASVQIRF